MLCNVYVTLSYELHFINYVIFYVDIQYFAQSILYVLVTLTPRILNSFGYVPAGMVHFDSYLSFNILPLNATSPAVLPILFLPQMLMVKELQSELARPALYVPRFTYRLSSFHQSFSSLFR